jgi:hypothetical protein
MSDGDKIAGHLRTIRRCWPDMLPTGPKASGGEVVSATKEPPPPAPIAVLSLRREVCEVLVSWVRLVVDDAVDVNGATMTVRLDGKDAPSMAGWLLTWADWLADHDAATVALDELGGMARRCDDVVAQRRARRFRVGPCIDHGTTDMGERVPCTGTLVATLSTDDDLLPSVLRCDVDPMHAYTASEWRRLGERIHVVVSEAV